MQNKQKSDPITYEQLEKMKNEFEGETLNIVAMDAVTSNGIQASGKSRSEQGKINYQYSIHIDQKGITAQKSSGRCWMFAALNVLRFQVIRKLGLDSFELSQNYITFYDKLEKANYFLDSILDTLDEPTGSRLLAHLLAEPVQDGGQWDMAVALINKYGVVPKEVMPETACSSATRDMNSIVTKKLREDACVLRKAASEGKSDEELVAMKEEMMSVIYRMLAICLGTPPDRFDFEIRNKDNEFICDRNITPKEFLDKYVGMDLSEYISLINAPTDDKPYYKSYTVAYLGNVEDGSPVHYVNVPIEVLKNAAIAQMKDGEPVWFGSDVGQSSDRNSGVMDLNVYDYDLLFSTGFNMDKAARLDYGDSQMTHAMVLEGADFDENGAPVRWCVENSWGEEPGKKGMFLMTDAWFSEYVYQVVVRKKYLPEEVIDAYAEEPVVLDPWDPMGSLA